MAKPEFNGLDREDDLDSRERIAETRDQSPAERMTLRPQEIALEDPISKYLFQPSARKPFVSTPAALDAFGVETILICLTRLQQKAALHNGLDYLQIFEDTTTHTRLWFIEDDEGGAITALLPSDY